MISKWVGYDNLLVNGISWSYNFITHLLTIAPNFLAHPFDVFCLGSFLLGGSSPRLSHTWVPRNHWDRWFSSPKDDPPRLRGALKTGLRLEGFGGIFGKSWKNPAENTHLPPQKKYPIESPGRIHIYIYIYCRCVY